MEGWRSSEKFGLNRYVPVSEDSSPRPSRLEVASPQAAKTMTVLITSWASTAEPRLVSPPRAKVDHRLFLSVDDPLVREYPVRGGGSFTVGGRAVGHSAEPPRAGLINIEYLDSNGRTVGDKTQHFESDAPFLIWMEPPLETAVARVQFLRAEAKRPLALLGEPHLEETVLQQAEDTQTLPLPQSLRNSVDGGQKYVVEGQCLSEGPKSARGAVIRIEALAEKDLPIHSPLEGWEQSPDLGTYRFIETERAMSDGDGFEIDFVAPTDARAVAIQILPWAATARPYLSGAVTLRADPSINLLRDRPAVFNFPVEDWGGHLLTGELSGSSPAADRLALISARFFDADDQLLPGPYPGFGQSSDPSIGYYQYVSPLVEESRTEFVQWIEPIELSARVELSVRRWKGPEDLALVRPPEFGKARPDVLEGLLDRNPESASLLTILARLHAVQGNLTAHIETVRRKAALLRTPAAVTEFRRSAGRRRELDTSWLPGLNGRRKAHGTQQGEQICHLFKVSYPFESSGGAIRNLNTVVSQRAAGLDPYVITPLNYPATHGVEGAEAEELVLDVLHVRLPIKGDKDVLPDDRRLLYDTQITAAVIEERGADIIHAASGFRGYELALKGLALARHFDKPFIYEVRSFHEHLWGSGRGKGVLDREWTQLRRAQELRCMNEADAIVTIAEAMREELIGRGVPEEKVHVVPNAVDEARFDSVPVSEDLRVKLGLGGTTVVGYISNISYREGHDTLIRAFAKVSTGRDDVRCLLVGDGPERGRIETLARALGVADRLVMTGEIDHAEIDRYYSLIDVFVVPRRQDHASDYVTPLKPYEALALKRAVIVSDRPSLREIVGDGEERGLIHRSEDPDHLAVRIAELLDDPARRLRLGDVGRHWVLSERVWRQNALRYREIYASVRDGNASSTVIRKG